MEGLLYGYLVAALCLLAVSFWVAHAFERAWLTPATFFAMVYVAHAFVTPISLYQMQYSTLNDEALPRVLAYSLQSMVALTAGFAVVAWWRSNQPAQALRPLYGRNGLNAALVLLSLMALLFAGYLYANDILTEARGAVSYEVDDSLFGRASAAAYVFVLPLFLSVFVSAQQREPGLRRLLHGFLAGVFLILLAISVLTFARHQIAMLVIALFLFAHFRVRRFTWRAGLAILSALFVVTVFAPLRDYGAGVLSLSWSEIADRLAFGLESNINPIDFLFNIASAIVGQDVFSQVVDMVPSQDGFKFGATYLASFVSLFTPRILTGDYGTIDTPAYWFKELYAPYATGHGFDFSMLSEAYMNFGFLLWVPFILVGAVVGYLSHIIRRSGSAFAVTWAIVGLLALIYGLRTDSNATLKTAIYSMVPVVAIFLLQSRRAAGRAPERALAPRASDFP